jgi:hypothetical protein
LYNQIELVITKQFLGENCGKSSNEAPKINREETKGTAQQPERQAFQPPRQDEERKRFQFVDGAYRMVFNANKNREENTNQPPAVNQFHTRTNIRDRSLDNWHGDADFA